MNAERNVINSMKVLAVLYTALAVGGLVKERALNTPSETPVERVAQPEQRPFQRLIDGGWLTQEEALNVLNTRTLRAVAIRSVPESTPAP